MHYDDEEIFDAEEAAAYDASDVSDSGMEAAVMERAVMIAYDMMKKKKKEFKDKVEDARAAEQQYFMMERATQDLVKQYNEDVSELFVIKYVGPPTLICFISSHLCSFSLLCHTILTT